MSIEQATLAVVDPADLDVPRRPIERRTTGDRIFVALSTAAASLSLVIVGLTLIFLVDKARPALATAGVWHFFSTSVWNPTAGRFGVLGLLEGTVILATVALCIGLPFGVSMALFINEYAPAGVRRLLTSIIDLLAALPSLLFGIWAFKALMGPLTGPAKFLGDHLAVVPFLAIRPEASLTQSAFIAGVVVGIMILPIIASISRDVMAQVPREQCEGALALGGTRWGMIREVVLPFARSGIVGGALLGFGRALGETIAVALIIVPAVKVNTHILEQGAGSVAAWIAIHFGEASDLERSALVACGLALFLLTFVVNFFARLIVARSVKV
jgi:phosphate transport system permease protein